MVVVLLAVWGTDPFNHGIQHVFLLVQFVITAWVLVEMERGHSSPFLSHAWSGNQTRLNNMVTGFYRCLKEGCGCGVVPKAKISALVKCCSGNHRYKDYKVIILFHGHYVTKVRSTLHCRLLVIVS